MVKTILCAILLVLSALAIIYVIGVVALVIAINSSIDLTNMNNEKEDSK